MWILTYSGSIHVVNNPFTLVMVDWLLVDQGGESIELIESDVLTNKALWVWLKL